MIISNNEKGEVVNVEMKRHRRKGLIFTFVQRLSIVLLLFILIGCNKRITNGETQLPPSDRIDLPAFGSEQTFELATWNIENFPKLVDATVKDVVEIMRDLDIDMYALQEIGDTLAFRALLDSLPAYAGLYSSDTYGTWYQKTAVVYRKSLIQISSKTQLFPDDGYSFPRPPLQVQVVASNGAKRFDFTLIVVHLKASGGSTNEARRRSAVTKLHDYIENQIQAGSDPDFIVAGDWNDELTDPRSTNVFLPFLDDTLHFTFLTLALERNGQYTYIKSYNSFLDHILITNSIRNAYPDITTQILEIDKQFSEYLTEVSDHRPVAMKMPVFQGLE